MPTLKKPRELGVEAVTLAQSYSMVVHNHVIYMPADFETGDDSVTPDPERTIWVPQNVEDIQRKALQQFDTLFNTHQELVSFVFKVAQACIQNTVPSTTLLVRTKNGLKELREDGQLHEPTGDFVANTLVPVLNEDEDDQAEVLNVMSEWLASEEEAVSLLRHLSTALAPGWSAVKYVLLLGAGRNGKSVMLRMIEAIFGKDNCSGVTRQEMSQASPVVANLNGKLINLVFDGLARYVEDSSIEKTLIAGESVGIRLLYQSGHTPVQTNALFIEGLNHEPKSKDKSPALQARLVRFHFQNTYALDQSFSERITSERFVGALLGLLLQNYVKPGDAAALLAPTAASMDLQLDYMYGNSYALPFLEYLQLNDPLGVDTVVGLTAQEFAARFNAWRVMENDVRFWPMPDVLEMFKPILDTTRKSERVNGAPRKVRYITGFKQEALVFIARYKGDEEDATTVVDDGLV